MEKTNVKQALDRQDYSQFCVRSNNLYRKKWLRKLAEEYFEHKSDIDKYFEQDNDFEQERDSCPELLDMNDQVVASS